jgi:site-specific recombinase XerC
MTTDALQLSSSVTSPSVVTDSQGVLDAAFARFLRLDVANGHVSPDTIRGYRNELAASVGWCAEKNVDARTATVDDVKRYREGLVAQGRQPTTIAHKLIVLHRVYAAAVAAGLRPDNPAIGIRAPRDRRAPEDFGYPSELEELALLFRAVRRDDELKHLRMLLDLLACCSARSPFSRELFLKARHSGIRAPDARSRRSRIPLSRAIDPGRAALALRT